MVQSRRRHWDERRRQMTREEIIALAREVGLVAYGEDMGEYRIPASAMHSRLERFAALVAASEREACAKVCDELDSQVDKYPAACAAAIRARGA